MAGKKKGSKEKSSKKSKEIVNDEAEVSDDNQPAWNPPTRLPRRSLRRPIKKTSKSVESVDYGLETEKIEENLKELQVLKSKNEEKKASDKQLHLQIVQKIGEIAKDSPHLSEEMDNVSRFMTELDMDR